MADRVIVMFWAGTTVESSVDQLSANWRHQRRWRERNVNRAGIVFEFFVRILHVNDLCAFDGRILQHNVLLPPSLLVSFLQDGKLVILNFACILWRNWCAVWSAGHWRHLALHRNSLHFELYGSFDFFRCTHRPSFLVNISKCGERRDY